MNTNVAGKAYKFNIVFRDVTLTTHAGIVLMRDFIGKLGVSELIDTNVFVKARERGYPESENILSLCWNAILGGDCLPTLARAVVAPRRGVSPRFEPKDPQESEAMHEAGDGRVTRASVLAAHLPGADDTDTGSGIPEVAQAFFGSADHHGIYSEPTFQSVLLRLLLRSAPRPLSQPDEVARPLLV